MNWYAHLFQNFPQFVVIHTVKGFCIVNKAEIDQEIVEYLNRLLTSKEIELVKQNKITHKEKLRARGFHW